MVAMGHACICITPETSMVWQVYATFTRFVVTWIGR
jgi:hypothetical protein